MSFDARSQHQPAVPAAVPAHFAHAKLAPEVLAKVGEAFAASLWGLQQRLAGLAPLAPAPQAALDASLAEVARLERLGVQIQGIARVLAGDGQATPESIDLAAAARQTLAEWAPAARRLGVHVEEPTEPLQVEAVAGVVEQLLDLAVDHALHSGDRLVVSAAMQGLPAHPMLTLHVQRGAGRPAAGDESFNDLHWLLFSTLARASGLAPQRLVVGGAVVLMLGFPQAQPEAVRSAALLPRTPIGVGRQILLLEPREMTRVQGHRLMHDAGMQVDAVQSVEQARSVLRDRTPDVLVTGVPTDDGACGALVDELRSTQPRLRVIELVDDDSAFALSLPGAGQAGRVGRSELARTLVQAVSQELDAAWEGAA
jgi:hypothetical protein